MSEHLANLGDDAFWNATLGQIFVQKGARALIITLPSLANLTSAPDAVRSRMVTLTEAALICV